MQLQQYSRVETKSACPLRSVHQLDFPVHEKLGNRRVSEMHIYNSTKQSSLE